MAYHFQNPELLHPKKTFLWKQISFPKKTLNLLYMLVLSSVFLVTFFLNFENQESSALKKFSYTLKQRGKAITSAVSSSAIINEFPSYFVPTSSPIHEILLYQNGKKVKKWTTSSSKHSLFSIGLLENQVDFTRPFSAEQFRFFPGDDLKGYWICSLQFSDPSFHAIFIIKRNSLYKYIFWPSLLIPFLMTLFLAFILGIIQWVFNAYLYRPLRIFLSVLQYKIEGKSFPLSNQLPASWHALAMLFEEVLDENKNLVEGLEHRVKKRTQELERTLNQLRKSHHQLIAQEKMASLGTLVSGIAHEMRNPLNFVINFSLLMREELEKMKKQKNSPEIKNLLQNISLILKHADKANLIVQAMTLHTPHSQQGKILTQTNLLLEEYTEFCLQTFRAYFADHPIEIRKNLNPLPEVHIVPQDIGYIFLNLLKNSFDAMSEKLQKNQDYIPILSLTTEVKENEIIVTICDNGIGIKPSIAKKIFDPFFTTKSPGKGTGLGLSLSYDMIRKYHGDLILKKDSSKGTCFILSLPLKEEKKTEPF